MQNKGIDSMLLCKPENLFYLSGVRVQITTRPLILIFNLDSKPVFVIPKLEEDHVKEMSWSGEIRTYSDAEFLDESWYKHVGEVLKENSLERMGIEKNYMNLGMFENIKNVAPTKSEFEDCSNLLVDLRITKSEEEIAATRDAIRIVEEGHKYVNSLLREDASEKQIAMKLFFKLLELGLEREKLPIVLSGPRGALPHGIPSENTLKKGDFIVIDYSGKVRGYTGDVTRTPVLGKPSEKQKDVYNTVLQANCEARDAIKPGMKASEIDAIARTIIAKAGYGPYFIHRTGHGMGLETHERPFIGSTDHTVLQPGMIFTIEPGIYFPGKFGVRIEDNVLVTDDGYETLTTLSRELNVIE